MRLVVLISLSTGVVLDCAFGSYSGKQTGEHALAREILPTLKEGEILLGDKYYPSYFLIATLQKLGVEGVFPAHQARHIDFRKGQRLGKKDHLVNWQKPKCPKWMTPEEYDAFPDSITMRETQVEQKKPGMPTQTLVLVSTFTDPKSVTKSDLSALYDQRWFVETTLKYIKDTMGLDILHAKSPAMVRKEIWSTFLAYNLIRQMMLDSAIKHHTTPRQLSFKLTLQTLTIFELSGDLFINGEINPRILDIIAHRKVGNRPGRSEPRLSKRRKKAFPRLQKARQEYKNVI